MAEENNNLREPARRSSSPTGSNRSNRETSENMNPQNNDLQSSENHSRRNTLSSSSDPAPPPPAGAEMLLNLALRDSTPVDIQSRLGQNTLKSVVANAAAAAATGCSTSTIPNVAQAAATVTLPPFTAGTQLTPQQQAQLFAAMAAQNPQHPAINSNAQQQQQQQHPHLPNSSVQVSATHAQLQQFANAAATAATKWNQAARCCRACMQQPTICTSHISDT